VPRMPILGSPRPPTRATGLITTTRITHATPACWIAKVEDREFEDEIAEQYLAFRPDVLLGGGARHFLAERRADGRDMFGAFASAGYTVVRTREQLAAANGSRLLGVFSSDHMPFEIDRARQSAGGPSLVEMTRSGLAVLEGAERGFVVQIEAGRIDHSNHKNDVGATLHDILAADETLAFLLDYVDRRPDTLLIMASDHATGGGTAYGVGRFYRNASDALERIRHHDASFDHMLARLGRRPARSEVIDVVRAHTGITLVPNQAEILERAIVDNVRAGIAMAYNDQPHNTLGYVLYGGGGGRHADRLNVNFTTGQHTAGIVPVAVYGAPAGDVNVSLIDNTELFGWMLAALGAQHENPTMSEADAREVMRRRSGRDADAAAMLALAHD
jgi:alkaline phosphatase